MGLSFKLSISIVTIFMSICGGRTFEEDGFSEHDGALYLNDAVIINAPAAMRLAREADTSSSTQHGKQPVLLQPRQRIDDGAFGKDCLTTVGKKGTCKSFRDCFPLLKVAELSVGDGLAMGHYDTCSYVNGDNTEVFGVCCTEPVDTAPQETDVKRFVQSAQALQIPYLSKSTISNETKIGHNNDALRQIPAVWPPPLPPLPTHPPDHTAPTHPPSFIAGIIKPTTKIPAVYPTRPTLTTWPTIPTTTTSFTTRSPTVASLPTLSPVADGSCGIKNGPANFKIKEEERIVNGQQAQLNEFPWVVALLKDGMQFCGGSLVDNVHVLTAAHCIAHMTSWDVARLTVRLGDHNIRISTETEHVERKVKRIVRHRGFNIRTLHNDISILTLDQPVQFTKNVRPVCLPGPGDTNTYSGKLATVIGWGSLLENGPQPSVLQKVTIPIWMNSECRSMYGSAAPGGIVDHMMCAGNNNMDSCSGDSGGPLSVNEGGRWTQVGVVSWGIGCGKGQYPGVYTRVTSFLPWIQKNTMQY